jgi:hypothetical protein
MTVRRDVLRAPFTLLLAPDIEGLQRRGSLFSLPQHPDEHRPERPVLLAVDQELGEGTALRVAQDSPIRSARCLTRESRSALCSGILPGTFGARIIAFASDDKSSRR